MQNVRVATITNAVSTFLESENYMDLVWYADKMDGLYYSESITIPLSTKRLIEGRALAIKKENPEMEGLQSAILRASIMQKLVREENV